MNNKNLINGGIAVFDSLKAIKTGNIKQKKAYAAIIKLHIFEDLKSYSPILCGTIPLDIDTEESDLDIILNVTDLDLFKAKVNKLYGLHSSFKKKHTFIRNRNVLVTSFYSDGFEFQLFAQNQPTSKQYAYLHMIVEWQILEKAA